MSDASMPTEITPPGKDPLKLPGEVLKTLLTRNDAAGWARLAGHLAVMLGSAWLWLSWAYPVLFPWAPMPLLVAVPALVLFGFTLATMFACMHETVHRTAFKTPAYNDGVAWFAGLLSFYNSTFYRHYHGWHHRFTNQPGKDPELGDPKPVSVLGYIIEISAITWWIGKIRTYAGIVAGKVAHYPFIPEDARGEVVRSVRIQVAVYLVLIAASAAMQSWAFVFAWLLPLAISQPFLRMIVLAEHTGCTRDANPYSNTRTTYTIPLVHYLMWNMPLHAEHHRYPAVPFHRLADLHEHLKPHLADIEPGGYLEVQRRIIRRLGIDPA
jgi:fatty acid desaturase